MARVRGLCCGGWGLGWWGTRIQKSVIWKTISTDKVTHWGQQYLTVLWTMSCTSLPPGEESVCMEFAPSWTAMHIVQLNTAIGSFNRIAYLNKIWTPRCGWYDYQQLLCMYNSRNTYLYFVDDDSTYFVDDDSTSLNIPILFLYCKGSSVHDLQRSITNFRDRLAC